ncbi:MAG: TIGR02757 family protein [candidate division NC10 bacterium]|nr:TIGR02757 family protein [candidate division NC10 bacterium]
MSRLSRRALRATLEALTRKYDAAYLRTSALMFPRRYREPADREVAGLLAASLAYGRVDLFAPAVESVLAILGEHPADAVRRFLPWRDGKRLAGFRYRLNRPADIVATLWALRQLLEECGSLKACFLAAYHEEDEDIRPALTAFVDRVYQTDLTAVFPTGTPSRGFMHLFPNPRAGGACKRLNLFLRWMVRPDDGLDFGVWPEVSPAKLIIPLDTHVARVARALGLTRLRSPGWRMAKAITEALKVFDPADPVRYDYALCRFGILEGAGKGSRGALWQAVGGHS